MALVFTHSWLLCVSAWLCGMVVSITCLRSSIDYWVDKAEQAGRADDNDGES